MNINKDNNDEDPFAAELMDSYLEGRKEDVRLLQRAVVNENYELVRMIGHNLFGSGGAYGLEVLSVIGDKLERAAQAKNVEDIRSAIKELETQIKN